MIHQALDFLVQELNDYIALRRGEAIPVEPYAQLLHLKDSDADASGLGSMPRIGCTVVNIEEEKVGKSQLPYNTPILGPVTIKNPPIRLNIFILFTANPQYDSENYLDALRMISYVIFFFQGKNEFTCENSPRLSSDLELLRLELYSIPLEQQNYLWSSLGTGYLPSVVYKMRLITVQTVDIMDTVPPINEIHILYPDS